MLRISELGDANVLLIDAENNNWTCSYCNSKLGRSQLLSDLHRLDAMHLWDDIIHDRWGDDVTVFDMYDDVEQLRPIVRANIKQLCNRAIVEGIDVDCGLTDENGSPRGSLHYSLSERHQTDMRDLASLIASGLTSVTWRDDSRVSHEVYSAKQFMIVYEACMRHVLRCRFRSDALETLLDKCTDTNSMLAITWDTTIPEDIQSHTDVLWATMYPND